MSEQQPTQEYLDYMKAEDNLVNTINQISHSLRQAQEGKIDGITIDKKELTDIVKAKRNEINTIVKAYTDALKAVV